MDLPVVLSLASIRAAYASRHTPHSLIEALSVRIAAADPEIFITTTPPAKLAAAIGALLARAPVPNSLPLWGVPFAVKDNIHVAGLPTTCACPAFSKVATEDAAVVARLIAAGGIVIGKTNLDQFATGLNGTRSPYGAPHSVFSPDHISGGSSSGSAVAVASGLASFALGTDTAGSGRVPAALNNIVGIKPTPGLISNRGMIPACESLDCLSIFALSVGDGAVIRREIEGYDEADPYSRRANPVSLPDTGLRVGVLAGKDREFCGNLEGARIYDEAIARLGGAAVEIDYAPFRDVAALLYEGPWVAERQAAFESFGVPESELDPSVAIIFAMGKTMSATEAFKGFHRHAVLKRECEAEWAKLDVLLLPTVPRTFTLEEMRSDPIRNNSELGIYTNFCNLLGLSAIAVPAGFGADGLPFGVTLVAPAFADEALVPLADRLHRAAGSGAGIDRRAEAPPVAVHRSEELVAIAVVGAHLSGMPLNHQLVALGGRLAQTTRTAPDYRLFALPGTQPAKPGLVREPGMAGPGIELEIWTLSPAAFGAFVAGIGSPLGIGKIALADGSEVSGFLCEAWAVEGAQEATSFGGWRNYIAADCSSMPG